MIRGMGCLGTALKRDSVLFGLVFSVVLLSRLPFLTESCGIDPDAWRIVAAAQNISLHGAYTVSRFPGYPVPEVVYALLPENILLMNGITALLSAVAAGSFAVLLRALGLDRAGLGALAFAATPVVYINSTMTIDYVWALAFAVIGMLALVKDRRLLSGVAFGLAAGCRLSSLLFLIPAALFALSAHRPREQPHVVRRLVPLGAAAVFVAGLCYLPAFRTYGLDFLQYYPHPTTLGEVLHHSTVGVWGPLGILALSIAVIAVAVGRVRRSEAVTGAAPDSSPKVGAVLVLAFSGILVFGLLFISLPLEEAYLIPIVPFVIIAVAALVRGRHGALVYSLIILSPFVGVSPRGISEGPVLIDYREKSRIPGEVAEILALGGQLPSKSLIIAGPWFPAIVVTLVRSSSQPPIPFAGLSKHAVSLGGATYVFRPDSLDDPRGFEVYSLRPRPGRRTLRGGFVYPERHASVGSSRPSTPVRSKTMI